MLYADLFGTAENTFEIKFVVIDDPGNPPDTTGHLNPAGSVAYSFRMAKYAISEEMIDKANALGDLGLTHDNRGPNKPATSISWFEAAQLVNWLNTSTGNTPAYNFDSNGDFQLWEPEDPGYNPENLFRNNEAKYFLPSMDEWYKAAFYDPATGNYNPYPTGGEAAPIPVASGTDPGTAVFNQPLAAGPADVTQAGGLSPYATMGQGGNTWEWQETSSNLVNVDPASNRLFRGGLWESTLSALSKTTAGAGHPSTEFTAVGIRVASAIPEPGTLSLVGFVFVGAFSIHRWTRDAR